MMKIMNKMIRIGGAMALLWAATGCVKDAPYYVDPVDPETVETGYLRLSDLGLYVVVDSETDQSTEASPTVALTRADDGDEKDETTGVVKGHDVVVANNDFSEFKVKICAHGSDAAPVFDGTYSQLRAQMVSGKGLQVPIGTYDIMATSNTTPAGAPIGVQARPSYAGLYAGADNTGVEVKKGETSDVGTITCKLQNIKITVTVAADLYSQLEPLTAGGNLINASVAYKDNTSIFWDVPASWVWTKKQDEQVPVYFPAVSKEEKVLNFTFTAKLKGKTESITMNREIAHVIAGQWRRIHVIPKHDAQGNLTFDASISTLVQDETITVGDEEDATVPITWNEQPYVDPDDPSLVGPSIKWADDTDLPETIAAAPTKQVKIAAPGGIDQIGLTVTTTNADFSADAEKMTVSDLCAVTSSRYLTEYGIPFGASLKGQTEVSFGLDGIFGQINGYPGDYTFAFKVTDQSGATCEQTLKFVIGGGAGGGDETGPTAVWAGGTLYDNDGFNADGTEKPGTQYVVMSEGMEIDIQLAADPHFESIKVKISGALTEDVLNAAHLSTEFDLCNLQEFVDSFGDTQTVEAQKKALTENLGLIDKVNDELKALGSASFSITKFVPIMKEVCGPDAKFQFALTVVDAEGRSTTKYLRLQNPAE